MSRKAPLDMLSLLAAKGQGAPANDAPTRPIVTETTNRRIDKLGFKVPKEFRHRLRLLAAKKNGSLVEVLRDAVNLTRRRSEPRAAQPAND